MDVTIVGTGGMARGIATRFAQGGHRVWLLSRDFERARLLAGELERHGRVKPTKEINGDVVVLALYYGPALETLEHLAVHLDGKVLVEITNPLNETYTALLEPPAGSAAQEIARAAPEAKVVKAFNTNFATTLLKGRVEGHPLDVFVAGDDEAAKSTVMQLIADGGMRPVDSGPLAHARHLEAMGFVHILVQEPLGSGYSSALKILP